MYSHGGDIVGGVALAAALANEELVAAVKNLGTAGDAGEDRLDGFAGRQLPHLAHAGLADLFNDAKGNLVCAAEVPNGKPAPDLFLEAAKRIGVDPARCRAYEDGESGLISAYRAGCHVIDVTQMDAYPMCDGLRRAKVKALAERSWL